MAQFFRNGQCETNHIVFRCVVGREQRAGEESGAGCNIEDAPGVALFEIPEKQLCENMQRPDIQRKQFQFLLQVCFRKLAEYAESGVVHQKVNPLSLTEIVELERGIFFGQIQRKNFYRNRKGFLELQQFFLIPAGQNQRPAAFAQFFGNGHADAGGGTGDECLHLLHF